MSTLHQLRTAFPHLNFLPQEILAKYSTVKIGGPAEVFCDIKLRADLVNVCTFCHDHNISLNILGWGANTLIADAGVKGLVIKNSCQEIVISDQESSAPTIQAQTPARWTAAAADDAPTYEFSDLDYDETSAKRVVVTMDAGVSLPAAINRLLSQGITGLQWYTRIPATVGGAIFNNIHGGTHFIGEVVQSVTVLTPHNELKVLPVTELDLGYDYSRFHTSGEIIISVDFLLYRGDANKAQAVSFEWAKRKAIQPQNSLGCVFQNLSAEEQARLQLPTPSIGYLIQHVLKLQGFRVGGAQISNRHAAFVENVGNATAHDYMSVIKKIMTEAQSQCGLRLKPEIFFLGFSQDELNQALNAETASSPE